MTTDQISHQWLVVDPATLVGGRIANGTQVFAPAYSLEDAITLQKKYPFSLVIEVRWRQHGNRALILYQGVVQP